VNLYEDDSFYDKFFLDVSPCGRFMMTGAYNRQGHIIDINGCSNVTMRTNFDIKRGKVVGKVRKYGKNKKLSALEGDNGALDFKKKVLTGAWHPKENTVALVYRNCIFLYYNK
jgi:hypothetical protein